MFLFIHRKKREKYKQKKIQFKKNIHEILVKIGREYRKREKRKKENKIEFCSNIIFI